MKNFRISVHADQQVFLRQILIEQRKRLGLSQRGLAERLGIIYSLVGKIETGDRRLDIFEFIDYCLVLELDPNDVLRQLQQQFYR